MEIEVSLKVRSAIKAKLLELGVHVDDELPDYIMVLVANRRTKQQMESDLELFLADNTVKFTTWLYHVLKKLEQVTLATSESTPAIVATGKTPTEASSSQTGTKGKVKGSEEKSKEAKSVDKAKSSSKTSGSLKAAAKGSTVKTSPTKGSGTGKTVSKSSTQKSGSKSSSEKTKISSVAKSSAKDKGFEKKSSKTEGTDKLDKLSSKSSSSSDKKKTEKSSTKDPEKKVSKAGGTEGKGDKHAVDSTTRKSSTSEKSSNEGKVQFKLKNNLVKKTEFDKNKEKIEDRKADSTSKIGETSEPVKALPTSTTSNDEAHHPDSSCAQEDILSLADDEAGDLDVIGGISGDVNRVTTSQKQTTDANRDEDLAKLREIALETKSPNRRKLGNVDAIRGIVMNNEKENTTKRRREPESKSRSDVSRSSRRESPPKKLRSVVTTVPPPKRAPSEEYDPTDPKLHKVSSVVCVTSTSQRPKRNTTDMNTNLIFKAMKEVEIENIKRPTSIKDDVSRKHRDDRRGERERERSRRRTRSRSRSRSRSRDRRRDRRNSGGRRDHHSRRHDRSRSKSPVLQLFTRKHRVSIKDRLGERQPPCEFELYHGGTVEQELELGYMNEEEVKAMENDLNIVINVPNIRAEDAEDGRNVILNNEKASKGKFGTETTEESRDLNPSESSTKKKGYEAPDKISIRVMNTSDESEEDSEVESGEKEEVVEAEDDSEDELEVTVGDDRDIDDLMPPPPTQSEDNIEEKKHTAASASVVTPAAPVDRLADLRAKLAAITRTNTASYTPIGGIQAAARPQSAVTVSKPPPTVSYPSSYYGGNPMPMPTSPTVQPSTCQFWPTCSFGENCKFIHPRCKYGNGCTKRATCPYKHGGDASSAPITASSSSVPPFKEKFPPYAYSAAPKKKLCLFFPKCHTMDCRFYHPKPCRYGANCTDSKCVHYHPGGSAPAEPKKGFKIPPKHQLKWSK